MPKYQYNGDGPQRIGGSPVSKGDIIVASALPGPNFVLVPEPKRPKTTEKKEVSNA